MHTPHIRTIITAALLTAAACVLAMPARKGWHKATLADGTRTELTLVGDEHGHWLKDRSGRAVAAGADGKLRYLNSDDLARRKAQRTQRLARENGRRAARLARAKNPATRAANTLYTGQKRGIVILVNFSDRAMVTPKTRINDMFNLQGYDTNHHVGSVSDYFHDQSYGKLNITFDIAGPYTLSKTTQYYGGNDAEGSDLHPAEMVAEAIKLADADIDFSKYDWDGDREVDQVFVMYAGYGENSNLPDVIWPHEWQLSYASRQKDGTGAVWLDDVKIDTYAVANELTGSKGEMLEGIGTACHEFSHCLGFPDFYDTDGETDGSGPGMQSWDILDYGSYNGYYGLGECPAAYTSYERWQAGWIKPTELEKACDVTGMAALADDPSAAYIIYNDNNRNEYYLLENRQGGKWETFDNTSQLGHGMLVLHVDYDSYAWEYNEVNNNASRQRMTIIPADNTLGYDNGAGDTYPGRLGKTSLTDTSRPAAKLNNANTDGKKLMHKPITGIKESKGLISFKFMGGESIQLHEATDITRDAFTITWDPVDGAESYTLEVTPETAGTGTDPTPGTGTDPGTGTTPAQGKVLLKETFSKFTSAKESTTPIQAKIDSYMETGGWSALNVYQGGTGCMKVGKASGGFLVTPLVTPSTGKMTVVVDTKTYNKDKNHAVIYLTNSTNGQIGIQKGITTGQADFEKSIVTFSVNFPCKVMFMPDVRAYIRELAIYDGDYTLSNLPSAVATRAAETTTIEGITETYYRLTNLTAEAYTYRVRAVIGGVPQPWSATRRVSLTATGIETITKPHAGDTTLYNLKGQPVGNQAHRLPPGIYIRRGKKVVIHD